MELIKEILKRCKNKSPHWGAVKMDLQNRFDSLPRESREDRLLAMVIQKDITIANLCEIIEDADIELEVWRDHYYSPLRNKPAQVRSDVYGEHREFSTNRTQRTGVEF